MTKAPAFRFPSVPFLLAIIALVATAFLYWATPDGPAVHPDSVVYLGGANNIAQGHGYSYSIPPGLPVPVTHYPPGFSLLLAAAIRTTGDVNRGARVVSLFLFALGVWLAGMVTWQVSGRNRSAGAFAAILYASNPVTLDLHACVISESLFLPLTLLCVLCTARSVETGRFWDLVAAGLTAGLAAATRYPGVVWIAAAPFTIFIASRRDWRLGFKGASIAAMAAVLPVLAMIARNRLAGGSATNREFIFHPVSATHVSEALGTIASWLLPWRFSNWLSGLLVAALVGALLFVPAYRALRGEGSSGLRRGFLLTVGVFCALYLVHLPVAISFLDFSTQINNRLLAPVEMLALCALAVAVAGRRHQPWLYGGILLLTAFYGRQSWSMAQKIRISGSGYRSRKWYANPAIRAAGALPSTALLWSNKSEGIYAILDRPVRGLPISKNPNSLKPNLDAPSQFDAILREAAATPSYVVFFHPSSDEIQYFVDGKVAPMDRIQDFSIQEVKSTLHLREIASSSEASVFSIGDGPDAASPITSK